MRGGLRQEIGSWILGIIFREVEATGQKDTGFVTRWSRKIGMRSIASFSLMLANAVT
jgi:hypothetical protein